MDEAIARLAGRQYGVVALRQLTALGLSAGAVRSRVGRGRLHRVHYGVYAVGHPHLTTEGRYMAGVLACGPDAALSHLSAAGHWGLRPEGPRVEVSVPRGTKRAVPGVRVHRARALDATILERIPTTTVARTIVDCAEQLSRRGVERMIERAEQLGLYDGRKLEPQLTGRHGAARIREVLDHWHSSTATKSDTEELLLAICRGAGLPQPLVNHYVAGAERDFVWPRERLIAEADARSTHDTPGAWERDRLRDQAAMLEGWRVIRLTRRQLETEPREVVRLLEVLLTRPPS